jgi:hypothetical protein
MGQLLEPSQAVRSQHNRLAVDREALGLDPLGRSRDRCQSHGPVICVAAVKPNRATVPADDNSVAVMFDFVNPVDARRRRWSFNGLSGDDEPCGKTLDLHCQEKIGRRDAANNKLGIVFSLGIQLLRSAKRS